MMSRHAPFLLSTLSWDNKLLSSTGWSSVGAPFFFKEGRQRVDHETNPTSWGLQAPGPVSLQVQAAPVPRVASPPLWLLVLVLPSFVGIQCSLLQY
jgi:hypothetical protein